MMEDFQSTLTNEPLYSCAYNEEGQPVNIEDVTNEYRQEHLFHCPYCNEKMSAKIKGEQRRPHFAHNTSKCDFDRYLHTIAIDKITRLFETTNAGFDLYYTFEEYCNADGCTLFEKGCNKHQKQVVINLKEKYDQCEKEKRITGNDGKPYIADILLSDSKGIEKPLLLEIWYTHKCEDEKLKSGLQIVEIQIQNVKDIDDICNNRNIKESSMIKLYNINKEKELTPTPSWCSKSKVPQTSTEIFEAPSITMDEEIDIELPADFDILQYLDKSHNAESLKNIQNIVFHGSPSIPHQLETYCLRALIKYTGSQIKLRAQDSEVGFPAIAKKAAAFAGLPIKQIKCNWTLNKDMHSMQAQLCSELFASANALIIFDDTTISYELDLFYNEAEKRNIPIIIIPFNQKDGLCPKCGRRMILKNGKAVCPKCYHSSLISY